MGAKALLDKFQVPIFLAGIAITTLALMHTFQPKDRAANPCAAEFASRVRSGEPSVEQVALVIDKANNLIDAQNHLIDVMAKAMRRGGFLILIFEAAIFAAWRAGRRAKPADPSSN